MKVEIVCTSSYSFRPEVWGTKFYTQIYKLVGIIFI